tara:strand:- start:1821 stop:3872 length:2052 start_codon:yes stop_codon:yes gene_type:complete
MNFEDKHFRQLGKTGLTFFRLGVGTASLAGVNMVNAELYTRPSGLEIEEFLNLALEIIKASETNMLMIDTSSQYGESESRLSQFITENPWALKKMYIATKWGLKADPEDFCVQDYSLNNLNKSVETSLEHLQKIDLLYIHTNPGISPAQLKIILDKNSVVIKRLKEIKKNAYGGVKHIGISVSTEKNLDFLIQNHDLLNDFDVLQITANIFLQRPDLARQVYSIGIGTVLNSPYRKGSRELRETKEGLSDIYCEILDSHKDAILLTGTINKEHLIDNVDYVRTWNAQAPLRMSLLNKDPMPIDNGTILQGLEDYFDGFNEVCSKSEEKVHSENDTVDSAKRIDVVEAITDIFVGSLKTRLGPAPVKEQRKILSDRVNFYVKKNLAIETILTWGPKKFFAGEKESQVDLSEAVSLERLMNINDRIKSYYSPGVIYIIFLEDFEGEFIEGRHLRDIFDSYISGFENLVKVLDIDDTVKIVRTGDLMRANYDIKVIVDQLHDNYSKLKRYWHESEVRGIENSETYSSYKEIEKLGWYRKIGNDTRDYYLGRLDRILGQTKTLEEKADMTIRLLACVLLHRQFNIFRINRDIEPVKLSFLKISGGPKRLMDGRIDIRTIPTDVSKKHIAPWAAKGCLRIKNDKVLPSLSHWRELIDKSCVPYRCKIIIERAHRKISFDTNFLVKTLT